MPKWNGPPPPKTGRGKQSPYPFKRWKVGQTKRYPMDEYQKIRNAIQNLNRSMKGEGAHWIYAQVVEGGKQYVRVWRES